MSDDPQGEVELGWHRGFPTAPGMYLVELEDGELCITPWSDGTRYIEADGEYARRGWTCLTDARATVQRWCSTANVKAALRPSAGAANKELIQDAVGKEFSAAGAGEIEALRTRREWEGKWHKALMTACVIAGGSGAGSPTECVEEIRNALTAPAPGAPNNPNQPHLIDGEFQSDKYPTTPRGKVPLSVKDKTAQDLLWEYAQRRRAVDEQFGDDLETALTAAGYVHAPAPGVQTEALTNEVERALDFFTWANIKKLDSGEDRDWHHHLNVALDHGAALSRHIKPEGAGALPAPGVREAMEETGWLIERRPDDGPPKWMCLTEGLMVPTWVTDASKALRFARRQDAEAYFAFEVDEAPGIYITEHKWMSP